MSIKNDESVKESGETDSFFVDAEDGVYDSIVDSYKGDKEMSLYDQEPPEEEPEASPEEEETDASTETDEAELPSEEEEVAGEEVKEDENTVPLAALHEEREKRKALSRDLEDLKTKFRDLFDDYKKLSEEPATPPSPYDEGEVDPRFAALEKQVAELRADRNKLASENKATSQAKAAKKFDDQVSEADSALEKDGYPGFKFSVATVDKILGEMVKDDPENRIYNNPDGWKKIYIERVFPDIQAKFTTLDKSQINEHKKTLKKKAGLVGNPGKKGAPPKKDEEKSETELYEEYLSMRQTKGFS